MIAALPIVAAEAAEHGLVFVARGRIGDGARLLGFLVELHAAHVPFDIGEIKDGVVVVRVDADEPTRAGQCGDLVGIAAFEIDANEALALERDQRVVVRQEKGGMEPAALGQWLRLAPLCWHKVDIAADHRARALRPRRRTNKGLRDLLPRPGHRQPLASSYLGAQHRQRIVGDDFDAGNLIARQGEQLARRWRLANQEGHPRFSLPNKPDRGARFGQPQVRVRRQPWHGPAAHQDPVVHRQQQHLNSEQKVQQDRQRP